MLHEDVRRILADDLRWRHPARFDELRLRALAWYRERMGTAPPAEREWLLGERFALWEDAIVQRMLFGVEEQGDVWLEPGRPRDHPDVLRIEDAWQGRVVPKLIPEAAWGPDWDEAANRAFVASVLGQPGAQLWIARDRDGAAIGFNLVVPVCRDSIAILFELVPNSRSTFRGAPMDGYALDLTRIGVERWIEAIMVGRRPPKLPRPAELERELRAVLSAWRDDARLAQSPLARVAAARAGPGPNGPQALRRWIADAVAAAGDRATDEQARAYQALELAYLAPAPSHAHAARSLAVSRATFYRLLDRATRDLARAMATA